MAAQGMLNNPAMYSGYSMTPECCIKDWVGLCFKLELIYYLRSIHCRNCLFFGPIQTNYAVLQYYDFEFIQFSVIFSITKVIPCNINYILQYALSDVNAFMLK